MLNGEYLGSLWITQKDTLDLHLTLVGGGFEPPASASRNPPKGVEDDPSAH